MVGISDAVKKVSYCSTRILLFLYVIEICNTVFTLTFICLFGLSCFHRNPDKFVIVLISLDRCDRLWMLKVRPGNLLWPLE